MTKAKTSYQRLVGQRVRVGEVEGILRGRRDEAWLLQDLAQASLVLEIEGEIEDASLVCLSCEGRFPLLQDGGVCAMCYRRQARLKQRRGPKVSSCMRCKRLGAYRNPRLDRSGLVMCEACWAATGMPLAERVSGPQPLADCVGQPDGDPRHLWEQVRASRWRCVGCHTDSYSRH